MVSMNPCRLKPGWLKRASTDCGRRQTRSEPVCRAGKGRNARSWIRLPTGSCIITIVAWLVFSGVAHAENIVFPADLRAIVDVTRPPYNADNTGRRDCTEALIRAINDTVVSDRNGMKVTVEEMTRDPRPSFIHGANLENRKNNGELSVVYPEKVTPSRILYFPNGIYKVSDTICYTFTDLMNTQGSEINRQLIVRGQSEQGVVIRLQDNSPGFEQGRNKPVFSFILKGRSNIAMANFIENLTISVGSGNPGASGLRFYANNIGAVRNVTLKSEDPEKRGATGLLIDHSNISCALFKNVTVEGFDYGVQALPNRIYTVFEHINLSGQRIGGFLVDGMIASIRGLRSRNAVPGLILTGSAGHVVLLDSDITRVDGLPDPSHTAIEHMHGVLFARNVSTTGFHAAIARFGRQVLPGGQIEEYSSHGSFGLVEGRAGRSLGLPVEEVPEPDWPDDPSAWISVNASGAKGDGVTDDTAAIQAALSSGKPAVYFQPGTYLINGPIFVPGSVHRINFMFASLAAGKQWKDAGDRGTFIVKDESVKPLLIEDLFCLYEFSSERFLIEHASRRTLILSDLLTLGAPTYFNSVAGGRVFVENVFGCSSPLSAPSPEGGFTGFTGFKPAPVFVFNGQKVWARQLNAERGDPQVVNDNSNLWVMGFKLEGKGRGFLTRNNGHTEIVGGTPNMGQEPVLVNEESTVSAIMASTGWSRDGQTIVTEVRSGEAKRLPRGSVPRRVTPREALIENRLNHYTEQFFLPLYVGGEEHPERRH